MIVHHLTAKLKREHARRGRRRGGEAPARWSRAAHVRTSSSTRSSSCSPTRTHATSGAGGPPPSARSTRSSAGSARRSARLGRIVRADVARGDLAPHRDERRPGHRRRPAQPPRSGPAVRRRGHPAPGVRTQGAGGRRPAAAVRRARRAQQVRAAGGQLADQGDPARRGRARPVARCHPHRCPADRERGRTAHHRQRRHPGGRSARSGRGRTTRVRVPARDPPQAGHDRPARHHVRQPARDPGAARHRVPVPGVGDPLERARRRCVASVSDAPDDPFDGLA